MAWGADFHRPAEVARQRVPTENTAIPGAGPDAAIGHGGRSETPFAGDGRGIMPGPEHLARASVTGFETVAGGIVEDAVDHNGSGALKSPGAADEPFADQFLGGGELGAVRRRREPDRAIHGIVGALSSGA